MNLEQKLSTLPQTPGVYIYRDTKGNILYVGKAKVLKHRVRSYFQAGANLDPFKQRMVKRITDLETISTDTEQEALILEANLIQKHQPPYNVILRDDKFYLFIKITNEDAPRLFLTRRLKRDGARYFGPYSSAQSVRGTLKLLQRLFPHRGEKEMKNEYVFPHPLFELSEKSAPRSASEVGLPASPTPALTLPLVRGGHLSEAKGVGSKTGKENYQQNIQNIIRFLKGDRDEIIQTLHAGMEQASHDNHFERAAVFRDQLRAIERLGEQQKVYLPTFDSIDLVSIATENTVSAANVFSLRRGKLLNKNTFLLKHKPSTTPQDILRQFLLQYYAVAQDIPPVIGLPLKLDDEAVLARWIDREQALEFTYPERGPKKKLLELGLKNAQHLLVQEQASFFSSEHLKKALNELAEAIGHPSASAARGRASDFTGLRRVEIYDISNTQGSLATGSMAVFIDGKPEKKYYKRFQIKLQNTPNDFATPLRQGSAGQVLQPGKPNDYAMIQQVLQRRFSGRHEDWNQPDLIIIDGGKGQLSAALKALESTASSSSGFRARAGTGSRVSETSEGEGPESRSPGGTRKARGRHAVDDHASGELLKQAPHIPIISLAKRLEEIFLPGRPDPVRLPYDSGALFLIQRMRDEAHRFTITYHRLLRSKQQKRSLLDEIPGIGPKTKTRLMRHFGSLKAIRAANDKDLRKIVGKKVDLLREYI